MNKFKFKKIYLMNLLQLVTQVAFFVWGIYFESDSNVIPANFLGTLTKVQTTSNLQNFGWWFY
jgi:hypothetical protein